MRIVVILVLFGFMQSAFAITKCEFKGKTLYKKGTCPKNAVTKYLVKDKYIKEEQLQEFQREHIKQSDKGYRRLSTPPPVSNPQESEAGLDSDKIKTKQMQMSNDSMHFNLQNRNQTGKKPDKSKAPEPVKNTHKINTPKMYDGVNDKLTDMERKLEEHNKALQQLQTK